ncbi:putative condensin complex subunit [Clavispora lusitaniae]|uniref:Nuclear condensin complex subunit 3 C-terminal domain-containing protein n=2 Tax=Clavispora lusitaniae TaxID=36911 RepID=C4Y2A9_CLAL4|nr:uncharacterized protein CLUG_02672 [Clavispora lusitaniae ATCC 42720]KAF5211238.1 hypothetical protein E0198_002538 [Clavispora lusitaniae]EEQ38546.1 hypothetical protein CLUG_02672 [Clavispora lusitaniae ATCC 42720]KAF7580061.1 Nuclear condensing complex subunit, C-term domain family protein [Clavispora lusitaniae]QFZ27620.1 putative condensin complex subunit [Clavispora lusitaniae]QFZ33073.1 putative condensin complex subunit [Clavispora lusitaniae]
MISAAKPTLVSIKKIDSLPEIAQAMAHIFQDAQMSLSGHRKLVVLLRHLQIRAISLGYEEAFNFHFTKLISKILRLKKGVPVADRIAKLCSVFVATISKEEAENPTPRVNGAYSEDGEELESVSSEFVDALIRHFLRGIESKYKEVRYRVVQLLAYLVNYITEIDEQLFKALHYSLNRRLRDREPTVRIQAVVAISRFQYFSEDKPDGQNSATKALLKALNHDDSPEVRRAALLNLVKNSSTIPDILGRARDVNFINRRLVYSRILKEFTSFQSMDSASREKLLHWGLNDRDAGVKSAAEAAFTKTWLSLANDDILQLLENIQIMGSTAAETAMSAFFTSKHDKLTAIEVKSDDWKELTVEKAFFIRTFFDYCTQNKLYDLVEQNYPELIKMAFILQEYLKLRSKILDSNASLVERYAVHKGKVAKFSQLLRDSNAEIFELNKKINKETSHISHLESSIADLKTNIASKKKALSKLANQKESSNDMNLQEISDLKIEIKDLESELEESETAMENLSTSVTGYQERLEAVSNSINHQSNERDKYIDSTLDLEDEYQPFGEQLKELEFIIEQLLLIIQGSDFADVAGTRRLMPIITASLTNDMLSEKLIGIAVNILRRISIDENYFSSLCTEIITDIRDSNADENDETFVSAMSLFDEHEGHEEDGEGDNFQDAEEDPERDEVDSEGNQDPGNKRRKLAPVLPPDDLLEQCLLILQHYLEVVEDTSSNIYQLESLIDTLIRPAISNNVNPKIRLLGYRTLGLFALIDKGLGTSNLKFFGMSASKAHDEELKILSTKIIFDVLSTHGVGILDSGEGNSVDSLSLARLFYSLLKTYEMPRLQAVVAEGLCKLFLADLLVDFGKGEIGKEVEEEAQQETQLLEVLLLSYFHPLNAENQELKQTLAFCLPVYAFSRESHQKKICAVSGDCFYRVYRNDSEFSRYENLAPPATMLQQLIYWCDPANLVNVSEKDARANPSHFWLVMNLLQVLEQDSPKHVKKCIIQSLSKMSLYEDLGCDLLNGLKSAIDDTRQLISDRKDNADYVLDAPTEKSFDKFQAAVNELVTKATQKEKETPRATPTPSERSRANSVTEMAETSFKDENDDGPQEREVQAPEVSVDTEHAQGANAEQGAEPQRGSIDNDLEEIDKLLATEEQVEYDVDME